MARGVQPRSPNLEDEPGRRTGFVWKANGPGDWSWIVSTVLRVITAIVAAVVGAMLALLLAIATPEAQAAFHQWRQRRNVPRRGWDGSGVWVPSNWPIVLTKEQYVAAWHEAADQVDGNGRILPDAYTRFGVWEDSYPNPNGLYYRNAAEAYEAEARKPVHGS